ncbi:MAG: Gfo/Idh/MocA family oxidoreductase [Dehalococcoidia bacterium]
MVASPTLTGPAGTRAASASAGRVRVGVIGYGYWGPNLARNIAHHPETELVAIADRDHRRVAAALTAHPLVRLTTDAGDLLDDPGVDAVAIATPAETHFALATAALERGKHVLVEKPLATNIRDAEALVGLARKVDRVLMVDHTFLFTGAVQKLKSYIASGDVGDLYYYDSTRINLGLFQHDINVIWDLAPHDISIMLHLVDEPVRSVSAIGARHVEGQVENIAYITLRFESQLLAHFHVNWLAPAKVRRTIIGGSKKMIVYDDVEATEKLKVYDSGVELCASEEEIYRRLVEYRTGDVLIPMLDKTEALATETGHFVDVIRGRAEPISDGRFGAEVVRILEAAQASLQRHGEPVEVQR